MTKEELIEALKNLSRERSSIEESHIAADKLLIEFINDPDIKAAYDAIKKWYA